MHTIVRPDLAGCILLPDYPGLLWGPEAQQSFRHEGRKEVRSHLVPVSVIDEPEILQANQTDTGKGLAPVYGDFVIVA